MRILIGDYEEGRLTQGLNEQGDDLPENVLQELKGRFTKEYREANLKLTEQALLAAATPDQDIIQAVHALVELDRTLNGLGKYTSEWYEMHHPEQEAAWDALAERDLPEPGLKELNAGVAALEKTREAVIAHIERTTRELLPNTAAVAGPVIAAKLLAAAHSTQRFANFSATTIQLLGAEQALFRHLRNRSSKPPKYGILFNHPFVQGVPQRNRGKMARQLANAIAIAIRVDAYRGEPVADMLVRKVEVQYRALARP